MKGMRIPSYYCLFVALFACCCTPCHAFITTMGASTTPQQAHNVVVAYSQKKKKQNNNGNDNNGILQERLDRLRIEIAQEELRRPPHPNFSAQQLIEEVLEALLNPYDPLPDAGFRTMLRTATHKWRRAICHSIGISSRNSKMVREDLAASALGVAMERLPQKNQFAILVGEGDYEYILDFPMGNSLDYEDGTCWVECRLRDKETNKLLVITGWTLRQRDEDGAWLVDSIDWQDFRDEFRPGIGREESWMEQTS